MPFTLIKGILNPLLGRPDGDSLRFIPDNPDPIYKLRRRGFPPRINQKNGSIQLRYEGIDTMESAAADRFAADATASNLMLADTNAGQTTSRGYIMSNQIGPNGRPIAFVFAGEHEGEDGSSVFLNPEDIVPSINVQQLVRGLAYPLFYDTLFDDLRQSMRDISLQSRSSGAGLWPSDKTNVAIPWTGSLDTLPPIFPKLWRRIQGFQRDETLFDPEQPFANFKQWVELEKPERVIVSSADSITGFDNLIETTDDTVMLTVDPHDVVIISV